MDSVPETVYTYSAKPDFPTDTRICKQLFWLHFGPWCLELLKHSSTSVLGSSTGYALAATLLGDFEYWGLLASGFFGFVSYFIWVLLSYQNGDRSRAAMLETLSWECKITPDAYIFTDTDGISTSIPWKLFGVIHEDPDAWVLSYSKSQLIIYRRPLRAAGLDDEFRKRLSKSPAGDEEAVNLE